MKITTYPVMNSFTDGTYTDNLRITVDLRLLSEDHTDCEILEFYNETTDEYIDLKTLSKEQLLDIEKFMARTVDEHYMDLLQGIEVE